MQGLWQNIRDEALDGSRREPVLASFYFASILNHRSIAAALAFNLALRLDSSTLPATLIREVCDQALSSDAAMREAIEADIDACYTRDPACDKYSTPLLFFKGYQAIQAQRIAHWLWLQHRAPLALYFQNRIACEFDVDIHPAAQIGRGIMLDHATGLVVGETAVIGDNVSLMHGVSLGGSGCCRGDRHPKIGDGVLIASGAKLLGNIRIGSGAKIAAGSVVLHDVDPHTTVAGVPAKSVGKLLAGQPALAMNQMLDE
jgi:serine O-acetyltransferase